MRTRFDDEADEDAAHAAREALVARFERWQATHPTASAAEPADVDLALGWKWAYGDRNYGRWTRADVDELLLDHMPRKLSAPAAVAASIPSSLAAFAAFLDEEGLLDASGDTADVVATRALAQTRAFLDAMDDPANHGMTKRLLDAVGVDPDGPLDQAELDAAMARFNALPFDERGEILGLDDGGLDVPQDDDLPPLPLPEVPPDDRLDEMAGEVPLLRKVDTFARALGPEGVSLTKAGNLGLDDGRRLVAATGTGDRVDGIRSTAELRELFMVARVALAAGATEVAGNRLRLVGGWETEAAGDRWVRVADALIGEGAATLSFGSSTPDAADLAELGDQMAVHVLAVLWLVGEHIDVDAITDMMEEAASAAVVADAFDVFLDAADMRAVCRQRMADVLANLGDAGVVTVDRDDRVALTGAGPLLAAAALREVGFGVLLPDEVAGLDAHGLIDLLVQRGIDDADAVGRLWAGGRDPGEAAGDLVAELLARPDPNRVAIGFAIVRELGASGVEAVRGLLDGHLAGHAWLFLAEVGAVDYDDAPRDLVVQTGIDMFVGTADVGSPADVIEMVLGNIPPGEHEAFVDTLAASDHPRTGELLELLGRHHPDRATGKYTRKAAHRWRSTRSPGPR